MADLDNKLVTFASLKETVTRLKEYANQFEPRKEVISKAKLTYSTNYIRAYCDYVATIPATVRVTDDDGSVLLVTGSANGSWRAVRLIKGETDRFHKVYYSNGYVYIQVDNDSMYTIFGGSLVKVFGSATGIEITIENADDTDIEIPTSYPANAIGYVNDTIGSATVDDALNTVIAELHTHDNKEVLDLLSESDTGKLQYNGVTIGGDGGASSETTYDTLDTTDKTIVGAINEVNGNSLDTVGFSDDYKNIILNRKSGLNPYTIPISAIINNASLTELKDIDSTDIGNGKTLVYDGATQKHKYVNTTGTDEFVKMDSTTDAKYLSDLIDKSTVVNDNGVLKVKKLDGQEVTITEINYLKGLTMNVMDLVNAFANGGVKVLNTPLNTASELDTMDRTSFTDGISYIVYVLADENHSGAKTTYLCTKNSTTFFGNADSQRNFTTNPIDLANEVTGKLGTSNIDVDNLWTLLTINDTYKTLTTNNEIFGTHGAKAMYDELTTDIGGKANATDLTTHTNATDIHVTSSERTKWDKVTDKLDTVDFNTHKDNTDIHVTSAERAKWDNKANTSDIPTKVSELENDSNYVTEEAINAKFEEANVYKGKYVGDLNDIPFIKSGVVYKYDIRSGNCTNMPVNMHGILYSTYFDSNDHCLQEYHSLEVDKAGIYRRNKKAGTWTPWQELATWNNKVNSTEVAHIKRFTSVPGNDWNNAIEEGYYSIPYDSAANAIANRPFNYAIQMRVIKSDTNEPNYVYQIAYVSSQDTRIYIRRQKGDGTWTPWQELATMDKVADMNTKLIQLENTVNQVVKKDVPNTVIVSENTKVKLSSNCYYTVINGVCYVSLWGFQCTEAGKYEVNRSMPKTRLTMKGVCTYGSNGYEGGCAYVFYDGNGNNKLYIEAKTANEPLYGSFSYPVAE